MSEVTPGAVIDRYLAIRAEREAIAERHKAELKPLEDMLDLFGNWLQNHFNQTGVKNIATTSGTAYRVTRNSYKVADPEQFNEFVEDGHRELVQFKPDKDALDEYMAEHHGALPPGLELNSAFTVQVRKA